MKVLIHSNAQWCGSGYGVQTAHALTLLSRLGHERAVSASYGLAGNVLNLDGVLTIPGSSAADGFGVNAAAVNGRMWGADVVMTLLDAWVFHGAKFEEHNQRWVALAPIDHEPVPPRVARALKEAWWAATFTRASREAMIDAGIVDPLYIPHAYDPNDYFPMGRQARREARERLGIPVDAFTVGVVAANKGVPSRKSFPAIIEAFSGLVQKHPDSVLVLHTVMDTSQSGLPLYDLLASYGIPQENVRYSDQVRPSQTPQHMNALYNSCDVLCNPAMGEGFGVPILEAQACGVPVLVGDWTAMSEVAAPDAYRIPRDESLRTFTVQEAYQYQPFPSAIYDRMVAAHDEKGTSAADRRAENAHAHALKWRLDAVEPAWREAFGQIEQRIADDAVFAATGSDDVSVKVTR